MSDTEAEATGTPTRLIAVHNFPKEQPQDLPLVKGSLYLGSYLKDEWWVGIDPETGQEGCFPANFVADEDSEAANKAIARVNACPSLQWLFGTAFGHDRCAGINIGIAWP